MNANSRRRILALCLAQQAIEQADEMQQHISARAWKWTSPVEAFLYNACVTGLVGSYMRPFLRQYGLRIETDWFSQKFGAFPKKLHRRFKKTHELLELLRNKAYAHYDPIHWQDKYQTTKTNKDPGEVTIIINPEQGSYSITSNTIKILPPQEIPNIRKLISFQRGRIQSALALATNRLRRTSGPGRYDIQIPLRRP